ncbi:MAG TPA: hypothetical protein VH684_13850 [Xanthobacteraceae bacterium]|jgi:hypothetical protein
MAMPITGELPIRMRVVADASGKTSGTWYEYLALAFAGAILLLAVMNIGAPMSPPDTFNMENAWVIGP